MQIKNMMVGALIALTLPAVASANPTAGGGEELATAKHCFTCHDVKSEKLAPSFTDISHRFKGLANAKPMLTQVVKTGTNPTSAIFHWSNSKMPPDVVRSPVSDEEAAMLVDYILSLP